MLCAHLILVGELQHALDPRDDSLDHQVRQLDGQQERVKVAVGGRPEGEVTQGNRLHHAVCETSQYLMGGGVFQEGGGGGEGTHVLQAVVDGPLTSRPREEGGGGGVRSVLPDNFVVLLLLTERRGGFWFLKCSRGDHDRPSTGWTRKIILCGQQPSRTWRSMAHLN